jgi:hypothetical protein
MLASLLAYLFTCMFYLSFSVSDCFGLCDFVCFNLSHIIGNLFISKVSSKLLTEVLLLTLTCVTNVLFYSSMLILKVRAGLVGFVCEFGV